MIKRNKPNSSTFRGKGSGQRLPFNAAPKVGIFWYFRKKLLTYSLSASDVVNQDEFVNSHYEIWNTFQRLDPSLKHMEAGDLPRGRVLFDTKKNKFKVYSAYDLFNIAGFKEIVLKSFNLDPSQTLFENTPGFGPSDNSKL